MRKILAVAFLGASLAFTASAAFAEGNSGHQSGYNLSNATIVTQAEPAQSVIAGVAAPVSEVTLGRDTHR